MSTSRLSPRDAEDHHTDQAVVAESVAHFHRPAFEARLAEPTDLAVVAAGGREVELVGPLRELRDAGHLVGRRLGDRDAKIQAREEFLDGRRLSLEAGTLGLLLVHRRPLPVFRRHAEAVECPDVLEETPDVAVDRQAEGQDLRAAGPDLGALDRVVIEEDEAVQSEVQLLRQRADILRLGLAS